MNKRIFLFIVLQKLNKEVYELSRQWYETIIMIFYLTFDSIFLRFRYEQLSKEQKDKISESFGISQIPAMDEKTDYCGRKIFQFKKKFSI